MEIKTDALLLRAVNYGENDKMVTLFTADRGKIGAAVKGVRKATAKLRFAAQPFCFAEYVLAERSGRYTVTSASLYDGFYPLREDIGAFYAATAVCEACDALMYEGMVNGGLFVSAVTALKEMCGGETSAALIRFLVRALSLAGYPVSAEETCPACGAPLGGRMRFDFSSGSFFCDGCGVGEPASESTYQTVRFALGAECKGSFLGADGEKRALRLLSAYYSVKTENSLPALGEYIRMI